MSAENRENKTWRLYDPEHIGNIPKIEFNKTKVEFDKTKVDFDSQSYKQIIFEYKIIRFTKDDVSDYLHTGFKFTSNEEPVFAGFPKEYKLSKIYVTKRINAFGNNEIEKFPILDNIESINNNPDHDFDNIFQLRILPGFWTKRRLGIFPGNDRYRRLGSHHFYFKYFSEIDMDSISNDFFKEWYKDANHYDKVIDAYHYDKLVNINRIHNWTFVSDYPKDNIIDDRDSIMLSYTKQIPDRDDIDTTPLKYPLSKKDYFNPEINETYRDLWYRFGKMGKSKRNYKLWGGKRNKRKTLNNKRKKRSTRKNKTMNFW
jgi:hypothetical protein